MPSQAAHLALANHNQELIDHLLKDVNRFPDWVTTVAFYRALHLVEAAFAADSDVKHCGDHGTRNEVLKRNRRYSALWKAYQPLWMAANVARYLEDAGGGVEVAAFSKYLSPDQVKSTILHHYLRKVESSVEQLLGKPLRQAPPGNAAESK
jgi:hypothetical protein